MVYDIGIDKIITKLKMLDVQNIPRNLSIALGNLALSPMKMAQIYTVFSNGGHMIEPRLVSKMVSKYGSIIYETRPKEIANFTKPEQAYLMTSILQDVIKRGTGKNAQVEGLELAGKTGTTNNYIDAWFCGYSPTITTIVWYGRDKYKTLGKNMTGGRVAAPVFSCFFYEMLQDNPKMLRKFKKPKGVYSGYIDGKLELYTKISPLPKKANKVAKKSKQKQNISIKDSNIVELYDDEKDNTTNSNQLKSQNSNSEDVEVLF
jgi:penicillin-binding protein 1A